MKDLTILNQNGQVVVTSRQIASDFEKDHKTVLRAIQDIIGDMEIQGVAQNCANLFIESEYQHKQNNSKQAFQQFVMQNKKKKKK